MRLTITMSGRQGPVSLPLHYQHLLQGMLYRSLENEQLAAFLHDKGFRHGKRSFKLFTFSRLFGTHQVDREKKRFGFWMISNGISTPFSQSWLSNLDSDFCCRESLSFTDS